MKTGFTFRPAGVGDINTIVQLAEQIWPETYKDILSPDQIEYMMKLFYSNASLEEQMTKHQFILAYGNDKPVGFASFSPRHESAVYKLHKLYALSSTRGQGLGRAFIQYILAQLKSSGEKILELNVNRNNNAMYFYEKVGFQTVRTEDIDIGNGYWMNDYVMRLITSPDISY